MPNSKRAILAAALKRTILLFFVVLLIGIAQPCTAGTFFDDFNDGNADGWVFPFNYDQSQGPGLWSVEEGTLVQRFFGDGNCGLVDNLVISGQVLEAQMNTVGYAGVVLWYNQVNSTWANYVAVFHNYETGMWVYELTDGIAYVYPYGGPWIGSDTPYDLMVDADSATGGLAVNLDGVYLFTHLASTPYRTGLSGVYSGNEVGYFDNFKVTSDDIPIPVTINIRPEGDSNRINLRSKGKIPVAILSTDDFNAPSQVDQSSLTFGATGNEQSLISCKRKLKDADEDGLKDDLVCHFSIQLTGFKC
jgi:hypothetical protein